MAIEHMSIDKALAHMASHSRQFPTHSSDCSCKDRFTVAAKNYIRENPHLYFELNLLAQRVRNDSNLLVDVSKKLGKVK